MSRRAILFDFGGTLDGPSHWHDRFLARYRASGLGLSRDELDSAYFLRNSSCTVTAGVYLLPSRVFDFAQAARAAGLGALRQFLAMLIMDGMRFGAIELEGVIDVDEEADLDAARAMRAR
jgi:hypothetical protein